MLNILLFTVRLEDTECNIFFAFLGRQLVCRPFAHSCSHRAVYTSADCNQQPFCTGLPYIGFQEVYPPLCLRFHINGRLYAQGSNNLFLQAHNHPPFLNTYAIFRKKSRKQPDCRPPRDHVKLLNIYWHRRLNTSFNSAAISAAERSSTP
ncbi:hypothetical protein D3C74_406440 [compost metagenome]